MNYPDETYGDLWCNPDVDIAGETDADDANRLLPGLLSTSDNYYHNDGLFDLVWEGGDVVVEQAAVSGNSAPPPVHDEPDDKAALPPDRPSEHEMASWLAAIVRGDERDPSEKAAAGGATVTPARRPHHGETHNLTEKRRRCRINERLRTLQQLVPGCDKTSNHASTLEQTIRYMKWLQHQVQAVPIVAAPPLRPPAAVYSVAQPPAGVAPMVLGPVPMVPLVRPLLPYAHYPAGPAPAVLVPVAAAPPPLLYPAPASTALATPGPGPSGAANRRHGSSVRKLKEEQK